MKDKFWISFSVSMFFLIFSMVMAFISPYKIFSFFISFINGIAVGVWICILLNRRDLKKIKKDSIGFNLNKKYNTK